MSEQENAFSRCNIGSVNIGTIDEPASVAELPKLLVDLTDLESVGRKCIALWNVGKGAALDVHYSFEGRGHEPKKGLLPVLRAGQNCQLTSPFAEHVAQLSDLSCSFTVNGTYTDCYGISHQLDYRYDGQSSEPIADPIVFLQFDPPGVWSSSPRELSEALWNSVDYLDEEESTAQFPPGALRNSDEITDTGILVEFTGHSACRGILHIAYSGPIRLSISEVSMSGIRMISPERLISYTEQFCNVVRRICRRVSNRKLYGKLTLRIENIRGAVFENGYICPTGDIADFNCGYDKSQVYETNLCLDGNDHTFINRLVRDCLHVFRGTSRDDCSNRIYTWDEFLTMMHVSLASDSAQCPMTSETNDRALSAQLQNNAIHGLAGTVETLRTVAEKCNKAISNAESGVSPSRQLLCSIMDDIKVMFHLTSSDYSVALNVFADSGGRIWTLCEDTERASQRADNRSAVHMDLRFRYVLNDGMRHFGSNDLSKEQHYQEHSDTQLCPSIRSSLVVPVQTSEGTGTQGRKVVYGFLCVDSLLPNAFDAELDPAILDTVGNMLAPVLRAYVSAM